MVALPCSRRGGSVDWGGEDIEGVFPTGAVELPPIALAAARRGGGRTRSMSPCDGVAFG